VKNKNIKTQLYLFLLFLIVALFCFGENCLAEEIIPHLIINEIQTSGGTGKTTEEFIELYNPTDIEINLLNYKLTKKTSTGTESNLIVSSKFSGIIPAHKYFLIAHPDYSDTVFADLIYSGSSYSISNNNTVLIYNASEVLVDKVGFGITSKDFESTPAINPEDGKSIARKNFQDTGDNSMDFSSQDKSSPINSSGKTLEKTEPSKEDLPVEKKYSGKIIINEVYPSPDTKLGEKEFIEIKNISKEKINLKNWSASDAIHEGKSTITTDLFLEPTGLYVFEGSFFLNTPSDTARIFDENKIEVDSLLYDNAKSANAYAFNGTVWQWTSKATKGLENKFDEVLFGEIKKDKIIYVNMYANFEATTDDKAEHFTWNFGDGHKSYLKKTRHKYEKTGKYLASLKVTGEGADNLINFEVVVEKFGKAKVQIISLSPNPKGLDSKNEWLEILNATKKKIDLKGWSVATGWKNLANHPITKKFILKSGEARKLTRDFCAFSLGNKQAKIELRYPDGKVADKIKYDRKNDSITEDEIYQKENADWQWLETQKIIVKEKDQEPSEEIIEIIEKIEPEKQILQEAENVDFDLADLGKYSEDPIWRQKQAKQNALLFAGLNISPEKILFQNQSRVLGASSIIIPATKNSDQFWKSINAQLNEFIWF
jgi:hypothetical protein